MVYDCGACLAKYFLCLFNFIFFLAGTIIMSVGIWVAVDKNSFIGILKTVPDEQVQQFIQPTVIEQASYILIATGAAIFIISFFGYCGALRESTCLLTAYGICVVLILIAEVTAGGLVAAYKGTAEKETMKFLSTTINKYYTAPNKTDAVTLLWDELQANLQCCGVYNYTDYKAWATPSKRFPDSCCVLKDVKLFEPKSSTCTSQPSEATSYMNKGCYAALMNIIMTNMNIVIGVAIGLAVTELICICLAFCLCKSIRGYDKH